jgi:hypothetical protein
MMTQEQRARVRFATIEFGLLGRQLVGQFKLCQRGDLVRNPRPEKQPLTNEHKPRYSERKGSEFIAEIPCSSCVQMKRLEIAASMCCCSCPYP